MRKLLFVLGLLAVVAAQAVDAGRDDVYQWGVAVEGLISKETRKAPKAFLWIPPSARTVRGVVIGQHNMLEEPIFGRTVFRDACAKGGIAIVWITPPAHEWNAFGDKERAAFENMLVNFAEVSGYEELANAPIAAIGHSAYADYPYYLALAMPGRTLCAISIKGSWPGLGKQFKDKPVENMDGVPMMLWDGEYEAADPRAGFSKDIRVKRPKIPFTMVAEAGAGHFDWSDEQARLLGVYIRKAADARIVAPGRPLRKIDPESSGWLYERWHRDAAPTCSPAAFDTYAGDKTETFWAFDKETAVLIHRMQERFRSAKHTPLLAYVLNGEKLPQHDTHLQVHIPFKPTEDGRGTVVKFGSGYLDTVAYKGRLEDWSQLAFGEKAPHPDDLTLLRIERISGPVVDLGNGEFEVIHDRVGFDGKRHREACFQLVFQGRGEYRRSVQQARMPVYWPLKDGRPQTLEFTAPETMKVAQKTLRLNATASSGLAPRYFVEYGPATVDSNGLLALTKIPPKAKFPVEIKVCAYQYGRLEGEKVKSSEPVYRTIRIVR